MITSKINSHRLDFYIKRIWSEYVHISIVYRQRHRGATLPTLQLIHTCNETHATRYFPRSDESAILLYAQCKITADNKVSCNEFASEDPKSEEKRVAFRGQEHATRKPPSSIKTEMKN